jgi:thioredoxin-like negative regulator of GroEL
MLRSKPSNLVSKTDRDEVEISQSRTERLYVKLLLGVLFGIVFLVALFWGGHTAYVRWQERRLLRKAVYAIEHRDDRTAGLAARNVLALKPSSAPASRIMAQLAEKHDNPVAMDWRSKVVQLEPKSTEDILALARCALQFNHIGAAERAMAQVEHAGRQTAGYHAVAALLAIARGEQPETVREWTDAVRLAPNEKTYQLQLAIAQVRSRDSKVHATGEATLETLRNDPKRRAAATRALITDGLAQRANAGGLLTLARQLQAYPEATLEDRLLYLDFLHQTQSPKFTLYLTTLEKTTIGDPLQLATFLSWMSRNNLNLFALDFMKNVPAKDREKWPVTLAVADIYTRLKDWRNLQAALQTANWGDFDFLRHAYLTRALRAENKPAAAEREWATATKAASEQSKSLLSLVRIASEWQWNSETLDLLWTLAKYPNKQNEALQALYRLYAKSGDAEGLYRVLVRLSQADPDNLNIENNLAQVSLLLKADQEEARRLAAGVYQKKPSNPAYATTYAYSLLTKGDTKGALKVMSALTQKQLRDPSIAIYYGICLATTGDEKARAYLEKGEKANLLPEEKALIKKSLAALGAQRETP